MAFGVLHQLDDTESARVFQGARKALKPEDRMVTMDPAFLPDQTALARFVVSRDRSRNVREPTVYAALGAGSFSSLRVSVWHNALRIPYGHAILECHSGKTVSSPSSHGNTRFFGFPTRRILPSRLEEMELREVLAGLARKKVSLVY